MPGGKWLGLSLLLCAMLLTLSQGMRTDVLKTAKHHVDGAAMDAVAIPPLILGFMSLPFDMTVRHKPSAFHQTRRQGRYIRIRT